MRTIRHCVDMRAAQAPRRAYLIAPETALELSFGELRRESRNLARFLVGMGLAHSDKVGLYLPNG